MCNIFHSIEDSTACPVASSFAIQYLFFDDIKIVKNNKKNKPSSCLFTTVLPMLFQIGKPSLPAFADIFIDAFHHNDQVTPGHGVRTGGRIIGLLEAEELKKIELVINRIRMDMVKRGDMMSVEDVVDILAIDLIGVVPDDESIVIATNEGEPLVGSDTQAGKAFANICHRVLGERIQVVEHSREGNHRYPHRELLPLFASGM